MPEGSTHYKGLAVPLYGESEIKQSTAATDILTLTAATGASGDFLVAQTAGGGEVFVVGAAGEVTASSVTITTQTTPLHVDKLVIGTVETPTTAPTTGLVKGEMLLVWKSATHPVLGMCVSTATKLVQFIPGFNADTLGIPST